MKDNLERENNPKLCLYRRQQRQHTRELGESAHPAPPSTEQRGAEPSVVTHTFSFRQLEEDIVFRVLFQTGKGSLLPNVQIIFLCLTCAANKKEKKEQHQVFLEVSTRST